MKVVNDNIYNFFRYEKKYNDSVKDVWNLIKKKYFNFIFLDPENQTQIQIRICEEKERFGSQSWKIALQWKYFFIWWKNSYFI